QITDHYAIIPTGQGLSNLNAMNPTAANVYELIARRFLSIFFPPAVYRKVSLDVLIGGEHFFAGFKVLEDEGYLKVADTTFGKKKEKKSEEDEEEGADQSFIEGIAQLKKGMALKVQEMQIKEGETSPPKRYNSGTMILTMENAGQFIEDEELRAQIKGSGIGTSATRAEILKKLININYLALNKKTQIITPTLMGEMIYEVVNNSIRPLLDPALTASWEKGLTMVAEGTITEEEYMRKLDDFVSRRTNIVKGMNNQWALNQQFRKAAGNYKNGGK
ncbi:MAG: type IA DNA topoisomerase, partial [Lachnospiraceae bacterium]|nr:type IA DNA topoisomerase [Lachnospiraceae bacterium]